MPSKRVTSQQVAQKAGVSRTTVRKWIERGWGDTSERRVKMLLILSKINSKFIYNNQTKNMFHEKGKKTAQNKI